MANEESLAREGLPILKSYLQEAGVKVRRARSGPSDADWRPDADLEIVLPDGKRKRLIVEFKANSRSAPLESAVAQLKSHLDHAPSPQHPQPFLFSVHLGRPMREWLRHQNIWFADLSGNRFFSAPGFLVDREVASRPVGVREPAPSVFADRNSRILRYLLPRVPKAIGIRELARKVAISPAAVSVCLRRLREMGYLGPQSAELKFLDREGLLEEWIAFYRSRFRRQAQSPYYVHARGPESIIRSLSMSLVAPEEGYGLALHAGASLVAPFVQFREVHVYLSPDVPRLASRLLKALKARAAEGEANLVILSPFYRHSFLFDSRMIRGIRVVADLQLYLDLSCFPQRGVEQAEVILNRRLRPAWSAK